MSLGLSRVPLSLPMPVLSRVIKDFWPWWGGGGEQPPVCALLLVWLKKVGLRTEVVAFLST